MSSDRPQWMPAALLERLHRMADESVRHSSARVATSLELRRGKDIVVGRAVDLLVSLPLAPDEELAPIADAALRTAMRESFESGPDECRLSVDRYLSALQCGRVRLDDLDRAISTALLAAGREDVMRAFSLLRDP